MTALLQIVRTDEVATALADGPRHPEFGRLVDIGTSVMVDPIDDGELDRLTRRLAESSVSIEVDTLEGVPAGLGGALERRALNQPVLLLVAPPPGQASPGAGLFVAAGPELPVMGAVGVRAPEVIELTVLTVLGSPQQNSIFTETDDAFSAEAEQRLVARMRQLYGE